MSFNTNRQARQLRRHLGMPKQYTHSPWQWGYVAAVHTARTTTLNSGCTAGAQSISTNASIEANAMIVVGNGGPVQVQSVSGSGPFTVTLANRGVPTTQAVNAVVRVLATVDLYLDGWQHPPAGLPPGVTQTLTTGVRFLSGTVPIVGQVGLIARGTGLQRADRIFLGAPAVQSPQWIQVGSSGAPAFAANWGNLGGVWGAVAFRRVGDRVEFRGIASQTGAAGFPSNIFTLPVGYRPTYQVYLIGNSNNGVGSFEVQTNGTVQLESGTLNTFLGLDGLSFSIL